MQDSIHVSRGTVIVLSTAAALGICYTAYRQFWHNETEAGSDTKLHRSNAVRRRRRAWRTGSRVEEAEPDSQRVEVALEHLQERESEGLGYTSYSNPNYVNAGFVASRPNYSFGLLPSRLWVIRDTLAHEYSMSDYLSHQLMIHIQAMFLQEFLKEEFAESHLSDMGVELLCARLEPELDPDLVRSIIQLRNEGQDVEEDMIFSEPHAEETEVTEGQLPNPEDLASVLRQNSGEDRRSMRIPSYAQDSNDGNNVLDLLYRIGEEKAKWIGYQHRGVQCNGCNMTPIRGIRYHCANCWDYDLCEACEHQQIHHKTHVFYKIRIPAPTRGQIKLVQPKWYPGDPNACPESIPPQTKTYLLDTCEVDRPDLDALYDQFKCIAGRAWPNDRDGVGMAIDRTNFNKYFTSTTADRPPRPNLIYDRIFSFYDDNDDGAITFSEFARGMTELANNTTREARLGRLFKAFDLDRDGYVSRKDFLHMLQAYYALNKELVHEMVFAREDAFLTDEEMLEVIHGSNPISATFGGSNFAPHRSRHGQGKHLSPTGDLILDKHTDSILKEDTTLLGDRAEAIARQASEARALMHGRQALINPQQHDDPIVYGYHLPPIPTMREEDSIMGSPRSANAGVEYLGHVSDTWPLDHVTQRDVQQALGADIPLEDVMDPMDRRRVLTVRRDRLFTELEENNEEAEQVFLRERWQRRSFYTDTEQGFSMPAGYAESDSSGVPSELHWNTSTELPSEQHDTDLPLRSRSSSKVRFDESTIENDNESKSDISSRNTPVNERWGGFELGQPDRDIGVEIIYEAVQEAFNDMLDHFFKEKEDKAMEAKRTRVYRRRYVAEMEAYRLSLQRDRRAKKQSTSPEGKQFQQGPSAVVDGDIVNAAMRSLTCGLKSERAPPNVGTETPRDPTLPQNRPNAEGFTAAGQSSPVREDPDPKPDKTQLKLWCEHEMIERAAETAGGFGRLNKQEFRQKLRDEHTDIDIGSEANDENFWEAKADLGRFSFLSDWLEMASF